MFICYKYSFTSPYESDLLQNLGHRQQELLQALLNQRAGLSVTALAQEVGISRNAVLQHLGSLEQSGWVENHIGDSSGGRPARVYRLTDAGLELFPRHYRLMASLLIEWVREHHGDTGLASCLGSLGKALASEYRPRVTELPGVGQRIEETASIMHELGYQSETRSSNDGASEIVAHNCIFHRLASDCREVCQFDLNMLGSLLDARVELADCIAENNGICRFKILPK